MSRRFEVVLHNRLIGHLEEGSRGGSEFRFDEEYRQMVPRPVLGQKFEDAGFDRPFESRPRFQLPDFFLNLIPEGLLRDVLEEAGDLPERDDLALLDFVGRDLPGALIVRSTNMEQAALPLERYDLATAGTETEPEGDLHFSLAGVQLKFSVLLEENKLTLPAHGEQGEWIVKFDSPVFPHLPENELSMLRWAEAGGFDVPEAELHPVEQMEQRIRRYFPDDAQGLRIRRYDRTPEGRVHQEDMAQVVGFPPKEKYDQITHELLAGLSRRIMGPEAVDEMVRRLIFVIACGNNDAHLKNWSLIYPDQIQATWSPLYDQVATVAWKAPDRKLALKLASVKNFAQIDQNTFDRFAEKSDLDKSIVRKLVDDTLAELRATWQDHRDDWPLHPTHARAIAEHWRNVPLLRAAGELTPGE